MTKEFGNLLDLLKSNVFENIALAFNVASNYKTEFEAHFGVSLEDYEELYLYLKKHENPDKLYDDDNRYGQDFLNNLDIKMLNYQYEPDITIIPKSIKYLKDLEEIRVCNCAVTNFPKEISELTKLKKIEITNNKLTKIPKEIALLQDLEELKLGGNNLKSIPKEIGKLKNLTRLNLWANNLKSIPKEI